MVVQVDTSVGRTSFQRLKLEYVYTLSRFTFKLKLRRYSTVKGTSTPAATATVVQEVALNQVGIDGICLPSHKVGT